MSIDTSVNTMLSVCGSVYMCVVMGGDGLNELWTWKSMASTISIPNPGPSSYNPPLPSQVTATGFSGKPT